MSSRTVDHDVIEAEKKRKENEKLIQEERNETGKVKLSVLISYIKSLKWQLAATFMTFFLIYQAATIGANFWLTTWTEDKTFVNYPSNSSEYKSKQDMYLGGYGGIGVAQALFILLFSLLNQFSCSYY